MYITPDEARKKSIGFGKAGIQFPKDLPVNIYRTDETSFNGQNLHAHDYLQIWYVLNGCFEHSINDKSRILAKGDIFVVPPYAVHKKKAVADEELVIIGCDFLTSFITGEASDFDIDSSRFDYGYLQPFLISGDSIRPGLHIPGRSSLLVEELLEEMLNEFNEEYKYYELRIKANLLKLLSIIAREYDSQKEDKPDELLERSRKAIDSALGYIHKNYKTQVYIQDVCRIAMMSHTYFSNLFKQTTGKTFVEYINYLRISEACEILINSSLSVTEIALTVGYNDTAYFNKVFKRYTGLTPKQFKNYERQLKAGI